MLERPQPESSQERPKEPQADQALEQPQPELNLERPEGEKTDARNSC